MHVSPVHDTASPPNLRVHAPRRSGWVGQRDNHPSRPGRWTDSDCACRSRLGDSDYARSSRTDSDCARRSRDLDYARSSRIDSDCACSSRTDSDCACRSRTDLDHDCARQWAATVEPVCAGHSHCGAAQHSYEAVPVLWRHGPLWCGGPVRRQRISAQAGGDIMLIHHTSQKLIMISQYHYILKTMISRYHYIIFLPIFHAISWVFEDFMVPRNLELYDIIIWYHSCIWYHIWYHGFLGDIRVPRNLELFISCTWNQYMISWFLWYHIWYHIYWPLYHYMIYTYDINENNDIIKTWYHTFIWNHTMISYVILTAWDYPS